MAIPVFKPPNITPLGIVLVVLMAATGFAIANPKSFETHYKEILVSAIAVAATAYKPKEDPKD